MIDGVDVSGCKGFYIHDRSTTNIDYWMYGQCKSSKEYGCYCRNNPNCYFKQLKRKEQEYEELRQYHNKCCKEFENEKQALLEKYNQVSINFYNGDYCNTEHCSLLKTKEQECEKLKKQLMQKSEVDMFFNTPIEGWSNDPCGICPHKAENEELKKEIIDKNEKIKSICLKDVHTFADGTQLRYDSLDEILDIISRAKGEE